MFTWRLSAALFISSSPYIRQLHVLDDSLMTSHIILPLRSQVVFACRFGCFPITPYCPASRKFWVKFQISGNFPKPSDFIFALIPPSFKLEFRLDDGMSNLSNFEQFRFELFDGFFTIYNII